MGFFSNLLFGSAYDLSTSAALASPYSEPLEVATVASIYGADLSDVDLPLTRSEAMTIPSVVKARNLICSSISRLPLKAVRGDNSTASRLHLFDQMTRGRTNQVVLAQIVDDLIFYGRSYALITDRTTDGAPQFIEWLQRSRIDETDHGTKVDGVLMRAADIIRFDGMGPGLLESGREALRNMKDLERAAAEAGYTVPNLILKQTKGDDLPKEEIDALLAGWNRARRKKGGSVGFTNDAIDVEAMDIQREALLIEGQNWSALQIARLTGLPAYVLEASTPGSALNYVNVSSRNREVLDAVAPYMQTITETFSLFLAYGTTAKFDTSDLIQQDRKGRFDEYAVALSNGFLTVDEVRAMEGWDALPEPVTVPEPQAPAVAQDESGVT